jgi:large subunit ribosomal protein L25
MTVLKAQKRTNDTNLAELREQGMVPVVAYGHGSEAKSLAVDLGEFIKVERDAGETSTITLEVEGGESHNVLIHDIQRDAVKGTPTHVDFLTVNMNEEITVSVPLEYVGESAAVKAGGILVKTLHELEITAKVKDLPSELSVDITKLATADDVIHVSDITLPTGVSVEDGEQVVASIAAQVEEDLEASTEVDMDSIEVQAKGKAESEEESAE